MKRNFSQFTARRSFTRNVSHRRRTFAKKGKKSNAEEQTPVSPDQFNIVSDEFCGGSSLLRSREEAENVVPLSATITVGATQTTDVNIHEIAANLLQSNSTASLPLRTAVASDGTVQASADEANTSKQLFISKTSLKFKNKKKKVPFGYLANAGS